VISKQRYTPEIKDKAVRQVIDRGHAATEDSELLGVSAHSLYQWVNLEKPRELLAPKSNKVLEIILNRGELRR
jgi:transposase